ncbi:MAG: VOC family protein [Candidatus Bathyarchaeota archaeon]
MDSFLHIDHVFLQVENIPRSIEFYEKLGFKINEKTREGDSWVSLESGDAIIDLNGNGTLGHKRQEKEVGVIHFALKVKNIDETYEELVKRGVNFPRGKVFNKRNGRWNAFFNDPDGNAIHITT